MEELDQGRCSVVYFCPGAVAHTADLGHFDVRRPPPSSHPNLGQVFDNVRVLLDRDQGDCEQVFLTSHSDQCLERIHLLAESKDIIVLIELSASSAARSKDDDAGPVLRRLASTTYRTRHEHAILPFVLVPRTPWSEIEKSAAPAADLIGLGALDVIVSPILYDGVSTLVDHVQEYTKPSARLLGKRMACNLVNQIRKTSKPRIVSHRPDQTLAPERRKAVEEAIASWHFPAHEFSMDELTYGALIMLEHVLGNPELEAYGLLRSELMTFILATRRQYNHERQVHYHNWRHAVDVTQSLYCFLCDVRLCPPTSKTPLSKKETNAVERLLTPLDAFILLVSAIGHDVGHPGVNNAFLVASNHHLAQMYNDKSVLENYHCAAYSQILRRHWPSLGQIPHFRSTMISTILATDMQRHFEYMSQLGELKQKVQDSDASLSGWNDKDKEHAREVIMALLIKAADISNVARPFDISAQWARILMNEFARQGELEAEMQIPTCLFGGPPNREDLLAAAQSQKGFMDLFGFPLFRGLCEVMPNVSCTLPPLEHNKEIWEEKIAVERARREAQMDGTRSPPTYDVPATEVDEARTRKRESEPAVVPIEAPRTPTKETRRQAAVDFAGTPTRHPASGQRQHMSLGVSADHKRSSAPFLSAANEALLSPGAQSRRSSKDVALTQLHDYSAFAQLNLKHNVAPGSRRGSADASWSIQQSYPNSRRGSKDESLTTILVTSQGGPAGRSNPGSPVRASKASTTSKPGTSVGQRSAQQGQKPSSGGSGVRSVPSSRSHTVSSGTATTGEHSPSTGPSSIAPTDDEVTPSADEPHPHTFASSENPFMASADWPKDRADHSGSTADMLPSGIPNPLMERSKSDSPRVIARVASGESEDMAQFHLTTKSLPMENNQSVPTPPDRSLRESRSRSRLRNLKFWKKRRDVDSGGLGEQSP